MSEENISTIKKATTHNWLADQESPKKKRYGAYEVFIHVLGDREYAPFPLSKQRIFLYGYEPKGKIFQTKGPRAYLGRHDRMSTCVDYLERFPINVSTQNTS